MITSRRNPLIKALARLARDGKARREAGCCLAEGVHLVAEALNSGCAVRRLLCTTACAERAEAGDLLHGARDRGVETVMVSDECMARISTLQSPEGMAAEVEWVCTAATTLLTGAARLCLLAGVQDPGNAGAIVRTAEAAGATGILFWEGTVEPSHPAFLRGSMGSAFRVPCAGVACEEVDGWLSTYGARILTAACGGTVPFSEACYTPPVAIAVGSEGRGMPDALVRRASATLSIPMSGGVESLNVGVAAALILYAARGQWGEGS